MKVLRFFFGASGDAGRSRWILVVIIVVAIIGGTSSMAILATLNRLLTGANTPGRSLLLQIVIFCLVAAACRSASQILLMRFALGTALKMRVQLCRQIVASPLRKLEEIGLPRLLASFTENVPTVTTALTQLPSFCLNFALASACLAYMAWLSYGLILPVLLCAAAGVFGYRWLERKGRAAFGAAYGIYIRLIGNFRGLVEGAKELQLHREKLQDFVAKEIEETTEVMAKHRFTSAVYYAVADSWSGLFGFVVIGVLVFFYVHRWHFGAHSTTATGYVLAFLFLAPTLQSMTSALPALGQAALSLDKIESLRAELARPGEASSPLPGIVGLGGSWKKITTWQITHSYRNEDDGSVFTLGPANLEIIRGELVFITGGNGSGKTTLIKLLSGLYAPAFGEIRLDDAVITDHNREGYRQLFSAVFSDFFLFERLLGFSGTEESAQEYLQHLRLEHKVTIKQGRFSTTQLSQGQRKRLALLVAYLEDRPIYIFDEWASDQDVFFRNIFYNEILPDLRQKQKTVLVISHDDRYYHLADRIIKLDYGQVVECRRVANQQGVMAVG